MELNLNFNKAIGYKNKSQIARILTENWVLENGYCPNCGNRLTKFPNNKPVADFFCDNCNNQFELKSKNAKHIGNKVVDGTFKTMLSKIKLNENPNFFFLTYNRANLRIVNFLIIPDYFFVLDTIEERKPLTKNAKRKGWKGCYIILSKIPQSGRIFLVKSGEIIPKITVMEKWEKTKFLRNEKISRKTWILDIMNCVDSIKNPNFSLTDVYKFENILKKKHPKNKFIKDKIRQQLQLLRDKGFIEFLGKGQYRKVAI